MNATRVDKRTIVTPERREILRRAREKSLEVRRGKKQKRNDLPDIVEDLQRQIAELYEHFISKTSEAV